MKNWSNQSSPLDPSHKMTILEATSKLNTEHTAGIVIGKDGTPRMTKTFTGGVDWSQVDWDRAGLKEGDVIIGTVRSHTGGGAGAEHFSQNDIKFGRDALAELRKDHGLYPGVGVQIYLLQPKDAGGGTLVFNVARNVIVPVK